jgi:acetyl esterase/lipase
MFRDEALEYAQRLMAAAVPVEMHVYPDGFHGSTWGFPETEQSRRWRTDSIGALAAAVGH